MARRRCSFFFFNDTATTEIYTLSLHDALPIFGPQRHPGQVLLRVPPALRARHPVLAVLLHLRVGPVLPRVPVERLGRSEEHTSELQSRQYLVCRLLLEKKKNATATIL